ncbi:MAG: ParB N-terminal domain-containing protein [Candidatus Aenigmarchaeota archaeon]|nr:ParB N-terminal domain-containing protein [Candidatus Aenigmarchaeota archaeon]
MPSGSSIDLLLPENIPLRLNDVPIDHLKEHENVESSRVDYLAESIREKGLYTPILIDLRTNMIIDGHHRVNAFRKMGIGSIPALHIDYGDPRLVMKSGNGLTKEKVLNIVKSGGKLPKKSTFHFLRIGNRLVHVSAIMNFVREAVR